MVKVLVIGDSISMGYTPVLQKELAGEAEVEHNPENGGDTARILANIDAWIAAVRPNLICLNSGLHDIKRDRATGKNQVPLDAYKRNLRAILRKIRPARSPVIWISTTPVIEERHRVSRDFDRFNADIDAYNAAARAIADKADIPVIELHDVAVGLRLETMLEKDGVHFTDEGYEQLGGVLAAGLREMMP